MRSRHLFLFLAAMMLGSALTARQAIAAPADTPLSALTYIEDNAESLAGGEVAGSTGNTIAKRVVADWTAVRAKLAAKGAEAKDLSAADTAVAALSVRAGQGGDLRVQGNDVTGALAPLFGVAGATVPWQVNRLDYLARAVGLAAESGDWSKVGDASDDLQSTWTALRPTVVQHGGLKAAEKFDAAAASVKSSASTHDAKKAAKGATAAGDAVDGLEGVFGA